MEDSPVSVVEIGRLNSDDYILIGFNLKGKHVDACLNSIRRQRGQILLIDHEHGQGLQGETIIYQFESEGNVLLGCLTTDDPQQSWVNIQDRYATDGTDCLIGVANRLREPFELPMLGDVNQSAVLSRV